MLEVLIGAEFGRENSTYELNPAGGFLWFPREGNWRFSAKLDAKI
jgi:hypothetical protein